MPSAMSPIEVLRGFVRGEFCTDEECLGCGRISVFSAEADVERALAYMEQAFRDIRDPTILPPYTQAQLERELDRVQFVARRALATERV